MKKKNLAAVLLLCAAAFALVGCSGKSKTLFTAAEENNVAQTRRLIKSGADVNAQNDDDFTALIYAAESKVPSAEVVKLLIDAGADVNARERDGMTALRYAEERDAADVVALLKAAGAKE